MADKVTRAREELAQSLRQTNQAMAENVVKAQERNVELIQNTLENGIEVLKSYAQDSRSLFRDLVENPQKPQDALEALLNTAVSAQEHNLRYMQSVLLKSSDVLKSHVNGAGDLVQLFIVQTQKQQDAIQTLVHESVDSYMSCFHAPYTYFQQMLNSAQSLARESVETVQRVTEQGIEAAQQATHQGAEVTQKAARQGQQAVKSVTK